MSKQAYQTIILSVVASLTSLLTVGVMDHRLYAAPPTVDSTDSTRVTVPSVTSATSSINIWTSNPAPKFPGYPSFTGNASWSWTLPQCPYWTSDNKAMPPACVNTYDNKHYNYHVRKMQVLCPPGYIVTGIRVDDMMNQLNGVWPQCQQLQYCFGTKCSPASAN